MPRQKAETLNPKKSLSIYHSNIGSPLSGESGSRKDPKNSQNNFNFRDKRRDRLSFINEVHKRDLSNFEQLTLEDYETVKSRDRMKDSKAQEQEQMSSFILKFEKFMPASVVMKARSRLDMLE